MALKIKNLEVESLAREVADMTGETKTEAIRRALEERMQRLAFEVQDRELGASFLEFLEDEVWPRLEAAGLVGRPGRSEEDEILGFGPGGL